LNIVVIAEMSLLKELESMGVQLVFHGEADVINTDLTTIFSGRDLS